MAKVELLPSELQIRRRLDELKVPLEKIPVKLWHQYEGISYPERAPTHVFLFYHCRLEHRPHPALILPTNRLLALARSATVGSQGFGISEELYDWYVKESQES
jgi:hypothetical protein